MGGIGVPGGMRDADARRVALKVDLPARRLG
jgi:hypothetical protein